MNTKVFANVAAKSTYGYFRVYISTLLKTMRWRVVLALVLMLSVSLLQGAQLLLLVPLMQLVGLDVHQGSISRFAEFALFVFSTVGVRPTLITVLGAFVLLSTGLALMVRWQTILNVELVQDFMARLRRQLYRAIANADWLTFSRTRSSDFTHALTTELDRVGVATSYFLLLVVNALTASVYVVFALRLSVVMTALVLISGIALLLTLRKKMRASRWTGEDLSLATNGMYAAAIEHLSGMKTVKSYGVEERNTDIFSRLADKVAGMHLNVVRNRADTTFWFGVGSVGILSVILYVSFEVLQISVAGMLLLLFLFNRMVPLFNSIQESYQQCLNALPAFAGVVEMQARYESAAEQKGEQSAEVELERDVRFDGVSFAYDKRGKTPAIAGLDLLIPAGKTTAVVGPSGAGKSTVADLIMGLLAPDQGQILVDGVPLDAELIRSWREQIGYVAQDTFLFNDTVRANLLWARPEASEEEVWQTLELAAAEGFISELPDGLETILGDRGVRLSGGERQRLALARALLREPSLLILDEATSALDSENERRIQKAIDELHGSVTILVITHRLSTVRGADVIYVLESGRLVESGSWEVLMSNGDGRFSALAGAQGIPRAVRVEDTGRRRP